MDLKFVIYRDADGRVGWRLYGEGGQVIAIDAKRFGSVAECMAAVQWLRHTNLEMAKVDVQVPGEG